MTKTLNPATAAASLTPNADPELVAQAEAYCNEPVSTAWVLLICWREGDGFLVEDSLAAVGFDRDSMVKLVPPGALLADLDHAKLTGGIRTVYRIVEVPVGVHLHEMLDTEKRTGR